jgi:hypothetical protein
MIRVTALGLFLSSSCGWAAGPAEVDYMLNCQGCHLPDGRGYPERQVPDLRNRMGHFLHAPGGREYLVRVPGAAQTALSNSDLARLLNWMLKRFSSEQVPAEFHPYSATEVAVLRQQPLSNPSVVRGQLLEQISRLEQLPPDGAIGHE